LINKFFSIFYLFGFLGFFVFTSQGHSKETDQYLFIGKELNDSGAAVNQYVNSGIGRVLYEINFSSAPERFSCEQVASKVFNSFRYPFVQKIESWAEESGDVDLSPSPETDWLDFFQKSIYGNNSFFKAPFWQPLSATMAVNGVSFGTDKLGHFISLGEKYYQKYLQALEEGLSEEDAFLEAIFYGIDTERGWLGKRVLKVFSRSDLEANYQGFLYRRELCRGRQPLLKFEQNWWSLRKPFKIQEHVSPLWDESFYTSYFAEGSWKRVIRSNLSRYCQPKYWDAYLERKESYESRLAGFTSLSHKILDRLVQKDILPKPTKFTLEAVCQNLGFAH
jgi:hypothetical protein